MSTVEVPELFDDPSMWRETAIHALGLAGEHRCAGASTSAMMPRLIDEFADRLAHSAPGTAVDVGGGLGPVSAWLARRTGHRFVVVDLSGAACAGARRLFDVAAAQGSSAALPVATRSCSAALLNGVVSLLEDLSATISEAARVIRPGGLLAIADLTAVDDRRVVNDTNTFWTVGDIVTSLSTAGCGVEFAASCEPGIGHWGPVQSAVREEIAERYSARSGFEKWWHDGERIDDLLGAGQIAGTSLIARTPT